MKSSVLCPLTLCGFTGAELRSVGTEAGMFAIRARRKVRSPRAQIIVHLFALSLYQIATEKDFLESVSKVIKGYAKFSSTPKYMTYN